MNREDGRRVPQTQAIHIIGLILVARKLTQPGTRYQIDEELVGQAVVLWWGLFDDELFVEHGGQKYGPYHPVGGG